MMSILSILIYGSVICGTSSTLQTNPSVPPADHLVPPPLPPALVSSSQLSFSEQVPNTNINPSFMGRIANWFGFGANNQEVNSQSSTTDLIQSQSHQIEHRFYDSPKPLTGANEKTKSNCNPCNKVPWIPMVNDQQPLAILKRESLVNNNINEQQSSIVHKLQPPLSQTVKSYSIPHHFHHHHPSYHTTFAHFPPPPSQSSPNYYQKPMANALNAPILIPAYASGKLYPHHPYGNIHSFEYVPVSPMEINQNLLPIPVPNLSISPIPPIYRAKPFVVKSLPEVRGQPQSSIVESTFSKSNFNNIQQPLQESYDKMQSQIVTDSINVSSMPQNNFNIVKSVSLGEYTSSIEYPPSIIQSPVIDLSDKQTSFTPGYISEPIIVNDPNANNSDNLPSASSHNLTIAKIPAIRDRDHVIDLDEAESTTLRFIKTTDSKKFLSAHGQSNGITENAIVKSDKRDRETPKDLLDSPILYVRKTSLSPTTFQSDNDTSIGISSWNPTRITTLNSFRSTQTTPKTTNVPFHVLNGTTIKIIADHLAGNSDKKSKQIQIIIPYTSQKQPRPFKKAHNNNEDQLASSTIDLHDSQESKMFTATVVTQLPKKSTTTKYLTKVRASNLRELLQRERNSEPTTVDLSKLQKNIDGWTEQEFSMDPNRASTISLVSLPKNIPTEYLTTLATTRQSTKTVPVTTTSSTITSKIPFSLADSKQSITTHHELQKTTFEPYFADEGYSKFTDHTGNNLLRENIKSNGKKAKAASLSSSAAFWDELKLSISPITKEKVYVVTPQPWREFSIAKTDLIGDFKSPRFLIRPTPGTGSSTAFTEDKISLPERVNRLQAIDSTSKISPPLFGQMNDADTFLPSTDEMETIDGHDQIFTIVTTPASTTKRKFEENLSTSRHKF